jgi:hypothetical protein
VRWRWNSPSPARPHGPTVGTVVVGLQRHPPAAGQPLQDPTGVVEQRTGVPTGVDLQLFLQYQALQVQHGVLLGNVSDLGQLLLRLGVQGCGVAVAHQPGQREVGGAHVLCGLLQLLTCLVILGGGEGQPAVEGGDVGVGEGGQQVLRVMAWVHRCLQLPAELGLILQRDGVAACHRVGQVAIVIDTVAATQVGEVRLSLPDTPGEVSEPRGGVRDGHLAIVVGLVVGSRGAQPLPQGVEHLSRRTAGAVALAEGGDLLGERRPGCLQRVGLGPLVLRRVVGGAGSGQVLASGGPPGRVEDRRQADCGNQCLPGRRPLVNRSAASALVRAAVTASWADRCR